MSYALTTIPARDSSPAPVQPAPAQTPAAPPKVPRRAVTLKAEVIIPESAERFADMVTSAYDLRQQAKTIVAATPAAGWPVLATASHVIPGALALGSLCVGLGEGVAAALALWGLARCAMPARNYDNPVSAKTADAVQDAYVKAAAGRDDAGVAALRHAVIAALDEGRHKRGLSPPAELVAQSLAFTPAAEAADSEGRRAAEAAEALLARDYSETSRGTLDGLDPYEVLALEARASHFRGPNHEASYTLDSAATKAQKALDAAATADFKKLMADPEASTG